MRESLSEVRARSLAAPAAAPRWARLLPLRPGALAVAALLVQPMGPAASQGIDRAALEELFGEPVTTSATGRPQRASDVPVAMDIVTAEQIGRSGARNMPEVLARFTSLDVQQYNSADYNITARGYAAPNTPRMLVLVNGRQVYRDDYGRVSWENIPVQLSEIRQIEVVRGPNSALFGYNAGAGVINIITFDPAHDRVTNAVARAGNGEYRELSGVVSAPLGNGSGIRLSAGMREQQAWRRGYSGFDALLGGTGDPWRSQVAGEAIIRVSQAVQLGFDASYSHSVGGELQLPGVFAPWDLTSWSLRGRVTANTSIGIVEAAIYHNALSASLASFGVNQQSVTVAQMSDTVKLGAAHVLRPFLEFRYNEMRTLAAGGLMWNWALHPDLEWTTALRYDHLWHGGEGYGTVSSSPYTKEDYARDWETLSWNTGLVWKATAEDTLRAAAARGVVLPSDYDLSANARVAGLGLTVVGNPYLKPTTVDNYEIEYRRRLNAIDGRIGATGFFQINRGINTSLGAFPTVSPPTYEPHLSPYSIGSSRAYGVELSLAGKLLRDIGWGTEYRLAVVEEGQNPSYADFARASPRHLVSARIGWGKGSLRADLYGRYATEMRGYRVMGTGILPVVVDDYVSVSARVAYRLTERLTAAIEGSGLLHERQRQGIGAEAERRIYLSLRADL